MQSASACAFLEFTIVTNKVVAMYMNLQSGAVSEALRMRCL